MSGLIALFANRGWCIKKGCKCIRALSVVLEYGSPRILRFEVKKVSRNSFANVGESMLV
jgi:hypothetical protein